MPINSPLWRSITGWSHVGLVHWMGRWGNLGSSGSRRGSGGSQHLLRHQVVLKRGNQVINTLRTLLGYVPLGIGVGLSCTGLR